MTPAFRNRLHAIEEQMIRAAMPRTSAADPEPLRVYAKTRETVTAPALRVSIAQLTAAKQN